ncbi:hypothetical protein BCR35DRAFT_310215 [Leucosporidium creatinivorum]|uniref:Uncharacterized protein n=1 Tax=Leucosporidium creatinivorum TaxID=106004 RepID=A0A1Y2D6D7_9BASI|nr:hypothetical protein BCR35DRAFT_310215 [Leucosporidium creatinivorum]
MDAREGVIGAIELRRRAEMLEREIREWAGPAVKVLLRVEEEEEQCDKRKVEVGRTREMWREALLIVIHQMLFHHGPLHPSNRASLTRIVSLGSSPSAPCSHCAHAPPPDISKPSPSKPTREPTANTLHIIERALPWFLAATVAVSEKDRKVILEELRKKTPLYGGRNVPVVERIWARMDGEGWTLYWRQVLREEGITLMLA